MSASVHTGLDSCFELGCRVFVIGKARVMGGAEQGDLIRVDTVTMRSHHGNDARRVW